MKKIIALLLIASVLVTVALCASSCNKEDDKIITPDGEEITIIDDSEIDKPSGAPGSEFVIPRTNLTLAKDAEIKNGALVLYFNEEASLTGREECYIGILSDFEAYSVKASADIETYADMKTANDTYKGVALVPAEALEKGACRISITVGSYIVETFEFTVE